MSEPADELGGFGEAMASQVQHVCICENRSSDEVAIKLAVLTLRRHQPSWILHLFVSSLSEDLKDWLRGQSNVIVEDRVTPIELAWNVKPSLLRELLDRGYDSVTWIDSDVVLTRTISYLFESLTDDTLLLAEEVYVPRNVGLAARARAWGLLVARDLPFTPNSCVLRVTRSHLPFLAAWQELLDREDYKAIQRLPVLARPFSMLGDQDAMAALLATPDFKDIPIKVIRRGTEIAQCLNEDGFGPVERLRMFRRLPPLIHAQGAKPWRAGHAPVFFEVSPYRYVAEGYRAALTAEDCAWMRPLTPSARLLHLAALGNPSLAGLLPAAWKRLVRLWRAINGRLRKLAKPRAVSA